MITKATMVLECTDQNGGSVNQNIGYVNPAILNGTEEQVQNWKKALNTLGQQLNGLTRNTLDKISLTVVEDISSFTEGGN